MLNSKKKAATVCKILIKNYGDEIVERSLEPIDELVLTILSQNTNDINMFRAYENLKSTYPTWGEVLAATEEDLGEVIKSSGFFRVKARRIKATLSEIVERVGKLDLSHLESMPVTDATEWLTSLHGVGPKTAAIVLLFCFGMATLPVDTHVWRVTKRLGLIPEKTSREKAQILLEEILPKKCIYSMNHNLIKHGREVCKAQKPRCEDCFMKDICEFFQSTTIS
ncbi:MAG: endonuclease III [Candidatus Thorarchaeota archaeon]|nr:endonuclease III [Candidatus Thorarchaeota archaeon]